MEGSTNQFDVVIVGGGSAGCVLANRLSADPSRRVVLVEAGVDTPPNHSDQVLWDSYPIVAYFDRRHQWTDLRVQTRPGGPLRTYEQARVMGGGSSINGMMANRGQPSDYDEWSEWGAAGWSWESVKPYFARLERDLDFPTAEGHGAEGPLPIRRVPSDAWPGFSRAAAGAVAAAGIPWIVDQNAAPFEPAHFSIAINNERDRRASSATAYLDAATRARPNLEILSRTLARRLLLDGTRVTGVEIERDGARRSIHARETILAAGAIHSPTLLMQAGIGPGEHLQSLGIAVVADRPGVGANLLDHPMISISALIDGAARLPEAQRRHIFLGMRWSSGVADCPPTDMYAVAINRGAWHAVGRRIGGFLLWVNKAYSNGRVTLSSPIPGDEPDVLFNYLSDPRDLERMRDGVRFVASLFDRPELDGVCGPPFLASYTEGYKRLAAVNRRNAVLTEGLGRLLDGPSTLRDRTLRSLVSSGASLQELLRDDAALDAYLRETVTGIWHASGTCRMGSLTDPQAVCDPHGRVIGVEGLRVCDASIMPTIPCANPNVPVMMIAERMSEL